MTRIDEEFCKSKFDVFIGQFSSSSSRKWTNGPKNQPPDFYLALNDLSYAVEVTRLQDEVEHELEAWLEKFTSEIKQIAEQKGYLRGLYDIKFARRIDKHKFHKVQKTLRSSLLEYIKSTHDLQEAPEEKIIQFNKSQFCSITKHPVEPSVSNDTNDVGWSLLGLPGESQLEKSRKIYNLIEQSVTRKIYLLRGIDKSKILLLYDLYHAPIEAYQACKPKLSALLSSFHTIFIVQSESEGFILHSENHHWQGDKQMKKAGLPASL
jgi:hypothetical protein